MAFRLGPGLPAPSSAAEADSPANAAEEAIPATDIAAYMADILQELRALAAKSGFETLGRVLEIAETEAKLKVGARP